jgi:hypothetical protein
MSRGFCTSMSLSSSAAIPPNIGARRFFSPSISVKDKCEMMSDEWKSFYFSIHRSYFIIQIEVIRASAALSTKQLAVGSGQKVLAR